MTVLSDDLPDEQTIARIRTILCDVDGVLTDGTLTWTDDGRELKSFYVRDGMAVKLWQQAGFSFALLSARTSQIVERRAAELGIEAVLQGFEEKLPVARQFLESRQIPPQDVCYIGDDLPDIPVMRYVGLPVAVADAASDTRAHAAWITHSPGGRGAVREVIERLLKAKGYWDSVLQHYQERGGA